MVLYIKERWNILNLMVMDIYNIKIYSFTKENFLIINFMDKENLN